MRWQGRETSNNVEDRRGQSGFGGGMNLPKGKMGLAVLAVVLVAGYFGIDLTPVLEFGSDPATYSNQTYKPTAEEQQLANFSSVALIPVQLKRHAVTDKLLWDLSTVRLTTNSTLTCLSIKICRET